MKIFLSLLIFSVCQAQNLPNVFLSFYGSSLSDTQNIALSNSSNGLSQLSTTYFDPSRKNFIYVMGWQPSGSESNRDLVIGAFLNSLRSQYNIIHLDWSEYASTLNVIDVVSELNPVLSTAYEILKQFTSQGFNVSQTYIAGFSFGSIIASGIGRNFKNNEGISLARITALEPPEVFGTLSLTFVLANVTKLNKADAKFVDVIHTNVGSFGDGKTHGHVDFWPNGGILQPGCPIANNQTFSSWDAFVSTVGCSHGRAYTYFAESVGRSLSSPAFISKRCPSWALGYDAFWCTISSSTSMGFYADVTYTNPQNLATVNYYLQTNSASPYSKV